MDDGAAQERKRLEAEGRDRGGLRRFSPAARSVKIPSKAVFADGFWQEMTAKCLELRRLHLSLSHVPVLQYNGRAGGQLRESAPELGFLHVPPFHPRNKRP